jgi:hypothetical protein
MEQCHLGLQIPGGAIDEPMHSVPPKRTKQTQMRGLLCKLPRLRRASLYHIFSYFPHHFSLLPEGASVGSRERCGWHLCWCRRSRPRQGCIGTPGLSGSHPACQGHHGGEIGFSKEMLLLISKGVGSVQLLSLLRSLGFEGLRRVESRRCDSSQPWKGNCHQPDAAVCLSSSVDDRLQEKQPNLGEGL